MPFVQSDIVALESALASGEVTVDFRDRRITYRSIDEIRKALGIVRASVASQSDGNPETAILFMTSRTGY